MGAPKLKSKTQSSSTILEVSQAPSYDNNPFWQSTLFSDVYLRNEVPNKYRDVWEQDPSGKFYEFCERFRDLCDKMQDETFENWTERTTINRFIKPVLKLLGWSTSQQESWVEDESFSVNESGETKTYKPDFVIVNDPKQLKYIERESGAKKTNAVREESIITIEAKYWGRIDESKYSNREDKGRADKSDQLDSTKAMDFDEQCLKYVDIMHHDYGILTDGRTWRLFHNELSSGTFKRCYQFNLGNLIKHVNAGLDKKGADYLTFVDNAKYFYHLFSKGALYNPDGRRFVDELISDSRKYSDQIEEDLKLRFVSAMTIACNGFRAAIGKVSSESMLDLIRSTAESHIFTILFVRYCESRNVLPIRQNPDYRMMSLSNMIDKLDLFNPEKEADDLNTPVLQRRFRDQFEYKADGTELHTALLNIVDILQHGFEHPAAKFSIAGFKETVFSAEELSFTKKNKITNREFAKLLFELTYIENEATGKSQQIAYSFFAPRQLGSIYESFLEFRIEEAVEDLAFIKKQWVPANLDSAKMRKERVPKVRSGHLFFSPNNKERKITGSYYTPDEIVTRIVQTTLSPLLASISAKDVLKLKICDPAMGSGHFLSGSITFLAEAYLTKLSDELNDDLTETKTEAKHKVLKNCIFGVDVNPRAVKLAKMSLWLETASSARPLEHLDDQIKVGDSLIDDPIAGASFDWKEQFPAVSGFDAAVGNPPYIFARDEKFTDVTKAYFLSKYNWSAYQANTYFLFIERCHEILKTGGRIGMITPNNWLTINTAKTFRNAALSHFVDLSIINCLDQIFTAAAVDCSIMIGSKGPNPKKRTVLYTLKDGKIDEVGTQDIDDIVNFRASNVNSIFEYMEATPKLGDEFRVMSGLVAYEIGKGTPTQTEQMKDNRAYHSKTKRSKEWLPYVHGRDVCRFILVEPREYILYGKNLAAPRKIEQFSLPRVLVRQIPSPAPYCIQSCATDEVIINDRNSNNIICSSMDEAHFVSAVLNSRILSDWFIWKFDKFQRKTFPQFKVNELKIFPIPQMASTQKNRCIQIAKKLASQSMQDSAEGTRLQDELDRLVLEAFQIHETSDVVATLAVDHQLEDRHKAALEKIKKAKTKGIEKKKMALKKEVNRQKKKG